MSADNEIAIVRFADGKFGVEHMVSWNGDVEDIIFIADFKEQCTKKEQLFDNEIDALAKAVEIHDSLMVCEYGITRYEVA